MSMNSLSNEKNFNWIKIDFPVVTCISDKTDLPKTNCRHFLSDRVQKRNLVNFLSEKFLEIKTLHNHQMFCVWKGDWYL
jgi:hypothetical protein